MVRIVGIEALVVQHGEKVRAPGDPGLSTIGHRQAATVAGWLTENHPEVGSVWASPLKRAQQTAEPIAAAYGLEVQTDERLRERMNWNGDSELSLSEFLSEWQRSSADRSYRPVVGDSSNEAAERFVASLVDIERDLGNGVAVVVAHGGVTVDVLRTLAGDAAVNDADANLIENGVPCCAITQLRVIDGAVTIDGYPSTDHLGETVDQRPA
jgi:probable phosphoglycerate mutase